MSCPKPISVFVPGKENLWNPHTKRFGVDKTVPCGQCAWCRYMLTRQWAVRCYLEAQCHGASSFLTLTYAPEHLPSDLSLKKSHVQGFLKRLRRNLDYHYPDTKIRFFASGEYGDDKGRPHYHILIFGFGFPDKEFWKTSKKGHSLFRSAFLEKCWKKGHSWIGDVELESASYVAGYIRKKINGEAAEKHYSGREPEFSLQSTSPGIGAAWYEKNNHWLWKDLEIRIANRSYRPPRYFEKLLEKENPELYSEVKAKKLLLALNYEREFNAKNPLIEDQGYHYIEDIPSDGEDQE